MHIQTLNQTIKTLEGLRNAVGSFTRADVDLTLGLLRREFEALSEKPIEQEPVAGLHAVYFRNNWDGEGDLEYVLAYLSEKGEWTLHENGAPLIEFEGDEIIKTWPLTFESAAPQPAQQDGTLINEGTKATVRQGWKLVPVEPTPEMVNAGGFTDTITEDSYTGAFEHCIGDKAATECYLAMLAVAPQPAQRLPLTKGQLHGLIGDAAVLVGKEFEEDFFAAASKLIRMTEAAHNIKQQPGQQVCQNSELALNSKPAQQTPSQCSKCEVSDPAFTDVCQVPACGMREGG